MSGQRPDAARARRIVYVWDADYPWDVRTEKICLALSRAGHDVHIVARNASWRSEQERLPEGTVHRMRPWRAIGKRADSILGFPAFFSPRWERLLSRTVRETSADLIIARDLPLCPTALHVGRRFGVPVILDMAENYPAMMRAIWETGRQQPLDSLVRNPTWTEYVERYCVTRCCEVITVVEESAARVAALGVEPARLSVVSNTPPVARARVAPPSARSDDRVDVVYMGNMEVARGLLESLDAVASLRAAGHPVRLRLIGRGRDDILIRERAAALGLGADAVDFLGYVASHSEALAIVGAADIGLIPHRKCESWDTTIPNKLFDYMAAGLPVVSSNATPCARILVETGAGVIFESGSAASLGAAIERLRDPCTRRLLGTAGISAVLDRYNWEHDTKTLLDVVQRC